MDKSLIEKARRFVENEIKKPASILPVDFYFDHLVPMQKHAKKLCRKLGGDFEIVLLAAWLHDIGSVIYGRKYHHISSAKVAKDFLEKENYDQTKTSKVLACIKHHRQSTNFKRETLEEKIIADADAICNFDMLPGLFYATLVIEKLTPVEAAKSVKKKLKNKWRRLHFKESKILIRPKYKAAMLLLKEITKINQK
jgi:uncharacterized protein